MHRRCELELFALVGEGQRSFSKLLWRVAKLVFESAVEGGVIVKAAQRIYLGGVYALLKKFFSQIKAFQLDILPCRCSYISFK